MVYVGSTTKTPTAQQARILQLVHNRAQYEFFVEQGLDLPPQLQCFEEVPVYLLIHGLPGAGKSQILLWLRQYFEEVWSYRHGDEFVFVAGQNSMSDNIGGYTMHSFFGLAFKDKRGMTINSAEHDRNWSVKLTKMSLLRYIFIDEVEAVSAEILGKVEEETRKHTRRPDCYRLQENQDAAALSLPRAWGGVNVFMIGDWWQLHPTGGIAIMSNPLAKNVLECECSEFHSSLHLKHCAF